jgi:hypothetical protein
VPDTICLTPFALKQQPTIKDAAFSLCRPLAFFLFERRSKRPFVTKQAAAKPDLTKEEALRQVTRLTGVSEETLLQSRRGRGGNAPRVLALWWLIHGAGLSNVEVSGLLGMSPSGVSKILARIKEPGPYQGGKIAEWMRQLKESV